MSDGMILRKLGGTYQLVIDDPADLEHILSLDEARWMATSAPLNGFVHDDAFLQRLDTDDNGRIRSGEVKEALRWLLKVLKGPQELRGADDGLPLDAFDADDAEGAALRDAARHALDNLGLNDANAIRLEQAADQKRILSQGLRNGDGVIPPASIEDDDAKSLALDVLKTTGSVKDRNGQEGVNTTLLDQFKSNAEAYLAWLDAGAELSENVLGEITSSEAAPEVVHGVFAAVATKIDEFFALCQLAILDERVAERIPFSADDVANLDLRDPDKRDARLRDAPLTPTTPEAILTFNQERLNPIHADAVLAFKETFLPDAQQLSYAEWKDFKRKFAPCDAWVKSKKGANVASLGTERLRALLDGKAMDRLRDYIAEDQACAEKIQRVLDVEKVLLFRKWFLEFANNFVSFQRLFDPKATSMLQVGRLILDGRHFDLNVKVANRAEHKKLATRSGICVMYVELTDKENGADRSQEVACAVTSGDTSRLFVGKIGVFIDSTGCEWDAKIVDFIDNPVSLRESLALPFVKLGEFIKAQLEKFTGSGYKMMESTVGQGLSSVEQHLTKPAAAPAKGAFPWGGVSFLVLGSGLSLAAVGSAFAYVTKTLKSVSWLHALIVVVVLLLIVLLPFAIRGIWLLRKRNIAMFLEAGGWAINAPMRLSRKLGLLFTHVPALPGKAKRRRAEELHKLLRDVELEGRKTNVAGALALAALILVLLVVGAIIGQFTSLDEIILRWLTDGN